MTSAGGSPDFRGCDLSKGEADPGDTELWSERVCRRVDSTGGQSVRPGSFLLSCQWCHQRLKVSGAPRGRDRAGGGGGPGS